MKSRQFRIHNKLVSWGTETDAINSCISVKCPVCMHESMFVPVQHGLGVLAEINNFNVSNYQRKKLSKISDFYHASIRHIAMKCPEDHDLGLLIVFGETQPARYVFVYIGVLLNS